MTDENKQALEAIYNIKNNCAPSEVANIIDELNMIEAALQPKPVDKALKHKDEMFRYINATKQVENFNNWRSDGFPEEYQLPANPTVDLKDFELNLKQELCDEFPQHKNAIEMVVETTLNRLTEQGHLNQSVDVDGAQVAFESLVKGLDVEGAKVDIVRKVLAQGHLRNDDNQGWRDIESAPKDGTSVLLSGFDMLEVGRWTNEKHTWMCGMYRLAPTHWMPLPQPPSEGE